MTVIMKCSESNQGRMRKSGVGNYEWNGGGVWLKNSWPAFSALELPSYGFDLIAGVNISNKFYNLFSYYSRVSTLSSWTSRFLGLCHRFES